MSLFHHEVVKKNLVMEVEKNENNSCVEEEVASHIVELDHEDFNPKYKIHNNVHSCSKKILMQNFDGVNLTKPMDDSCSLKIHKEICDTMFQEKYIRFGQQCL